jgi:hypothetical protein
LRSIASKARQPKIQNPLPCLDSSKECMKKLAELAVAEGAASRSRQSNKILQILDSFCKNRNFYLSVKKTKINI